ncbi:hypothetical protein ABIA33_006119 [Streptacidiphilus sp. MAP12-16]|uniref:hypothetical protein n=1 Tax=Streptacidiphilus sp. MAP12-16 TaxID=3156300 RepID=UPI0035191884
MPRFLRYLLVWLSCTALTVTAVSLTVRFVVGSTAPMPPTAHTVPTVFVSASLPPAVSTPSALPSASPTPSPRRTAPVPRPSHSSAPPVQVAATSAAPDSGGSSSGCQGGVGTHTIQSVGGQATVSFGADAVCLVSAVPALGFTTSTTQSAPDTLTVTFSSSNHRSQLTATIHPQAQASTRETSW